MRAPRCAEGRRGRRCDEPPAGQTGFETTMTRHLIKALPLGAAALLLAACAEPIGNKETFGTFAGAALGGWGGSQIGSGSGQLAATAAGTLIGALIGKEMGASLDRADQLYYARTAQTAFEYGPSGVSNEWHNPDSGNYGRITPQPAYQTATGAYCREYQSSVVVGGQVQSGYGTACRQPDGNWVVVN